MTRMTTDTKLKLEKDILGHFPEIARRIGLSRYSYCKTNQDNEIFNLNDKDKTYLFTPSYNLSADTGLTVDALDDMKATISYDTTFKISATLFKDDTLTLHNIDISFNKPDHHLLTELVRLHKLTDYLANFKEVAQFIIERSEIVMGVEPTLKFNIDGELSEIGIQFKYIDNIPPHLKHTKRANYYTNSLSLYNIDHNKFYKIESPADALVFSKMAFLSIDNEDIREIFDCDDWVDLYNLFKENSERFLSLYDMSRF